MKLPYCYNYIASWCTFSRRLFNNRSQKSRYLRLPITFDRLCFSRVGEASESSFELSEVLSINPLESDAGMPCLRILLTSRREDCVTM